MIVNNGELVRTKDGETGAPPFCHGTPHCVLQANASMARGRHRSSSTVPRQPGDMETVTRRRHPRAYYKWNRRSRRGQNARKSCLIEGPHPGDVFRCPFSPCEQRTGSAQSSNSRRIAMEVTVTRAKGFSLIGRINPRVSKGTALAEWAGLRGIARHENPWHRRQHTMRRCSLLPEYGGDENAVPELKTRGGTSPHE